MKPEALLIVGLFVGAIVLLMFKAREKAGVGSDADRAAQADIPRRPTSQGPTSGWGRPGFEMPVDETGDAGVRPRL
jgi:hypothetical protein